MDIRPDWAEALADRYRIEKEIGRGGMASVYLAEDMRYRRNVAIKVLREELAHALAHDRFLEEIRTAARLSHPGIVPVYDSGEADASLYYVMPYEAGHSLRERLEREGPLPVADVIVILRDLCEALRELCEDEGFVAWAAYDGAEALSISERERVDLVLSDLNMPAMNGVQLFELMAERPSPPAFVLTSTSRPREWPPERPFLSKPIDFERLVRLVRASLR